MEAQGLFDLLLPVWNLCSINGSLENSLLSFQLSFPHHPLAWNICPTNIKPGGGWIRAPVFLAYLVLYKKQLGWEREPKSSQLEPTKIELL